MILKKSILIAVLILSTIFVSFTSVYAKTEKDVSGVVSISQSSAVAEGKYKKGEEIVLNVSIAVKGTNGINIFLAEIEYDNDLLEFVGVVDIKTPWYEIGGQDQIYIERPDLNDSEGYLCKIKFKVKTEFKQTDIGLKYIDAASVEDVGLYWAYGNINAPIITIKSNPVPVVPEVKPQEEANEPQNEVVIPNVEENEEKIVEEIKDEENKQEEVKLEVKEENVILDNNKDKVQNNNNTTNSVVKKEQNIFANNLNNKEIVMNNTVEKSVNTKKIAQNDDLSISEDEEVNIEVEESYDEIEKINKVENAKITANNIKQVKNVSNQQETSIFTNIITSAATVVQVVFNSIFNFMISIFGL